MKNGKLLTVILRAGPNHVNDLVSGRQPACLFFGIDSPAVNENVQCPWPAQANASGNLQFGFDALFQAHGLHLDIVSKEAALYFHVHKSGAVIITQWVWQVVVNR